MSFPHSRQAVRGGLQAFDASDAWGQQLRNLLLTNTLGTSRDDAEIRHVPYALPQGFGSFLDADRIFGALRFGTGGVRRWRPVGR